MTPQITEGGVRAPCPRCSAVTTFEHGQHGRGFGAIIIERSHQYQNQSYGRTQHVLLRCAGCGLGGLATIHDNGNWLGAVLEDFVPRAIDMLVLPKDVPSGITAEFREAEKCASVDAWRAASAMFRSTIEKALKANGYEKGVLAAKIDEAAKDGVITESRRKRAHEDVRVLGNDVLHDEWREVTHEEVELAHHYVQRILEDLYDDRASVEALLKKAGRIP